MELLADLSFSCALQRSKEENNGEGGGETANGENNESSDGAAAGEGGRKGGRRRPRGGENKERPPRRRGGAPGGGAGGDGGEAGAQKAAGGRRGGDRRSNEHRICVKLTNVSQESRARDIKQSLRERQCNPSRIVMKGETCYVHYYKPETDVEAAANQIVDALQGLTIKSESGERPEYPVNVELLKNEKPAGPGGEAPRVETTDVTAV